MHLGNLGAYIWIIAIVIAVVSRIVRSGRPAAPVVRPPAPATTASAASPRAQPALLRREAMRHEPLVRAPLVPPEAVPVAAPPPPPPPRIVRPPRRRAGSLASLFEDRGSMVRAIVAAEVVGPPRSLSEQGFWRPKHSEV